jgi:SAM-dependent methyltransferase
MKKITRIALDKCIKQHASDGQTLEIGSWGASDYRKYFPNCIGIDIRPGKGVDQIASVYDLPFEADSFENILCISVLEHLEDPIRAIKEMRRVLKQDGRILVSVPFLFPIHDAPGDYWRFTRFGLEKLFSAGWTIERLVGETSTQKSLASLLQRIGLQSIYRWNKLAKCMIYGCSMAINALPDLALRTFGDIQKKTEVPDAFAGSFFMVAKKTSDVFDR